MAMTQAQFDALVARLEDEAERNPGLYKLKLAAFASLGYLYVAGVLLALVLASVLLVAALLASKGFALLFKKLLLPLLVLMGVVVKSLWVKLEAPQGTKVSRREHPALFDAVDAVRRATRAPKAHTVLLTNELNAAIVQVPRLGLLGWQKNYLILGLPLMQILSPEEFKAVLAHEFGHLSGAHGRFGAWIYRVRAGWARLDETLRRERHWGSFMFVPFFSWFAPKFAAYSFVQARRQEYEADQLAAETIGAAPIGNALVRLDLKADELSRSYWPQVYAAADRSPTPAVAPFRGLLAAERRAFVPDAPERLRQALARETSTADTHPCLRDRMAALGVSAAVPAPPARSAAETLFGAKLAALVERFDREWQAAVAQWWKSRHEHVRSSKEKLAAYAARPRTELADGELFEYAQLVEEFADAAEAFELYRSLAARGTGHRGAQFACGRLLLDRGDDAGIRLIEHVMNEAPEAVLPGCEVIVGYLRGKGREAEAQPYVDRYLEQRSRDEEARRARETLLVSDTWLPHELSQESLARLRGVLAAHPRVKAAYLVRKQTPAGTPPLHVVGVVPKSPWYKLERNNANQRLLDELASTVAIADEVLFITVNGEQQPFRKRFKKVKSSRIC